MKNEDKHTHDNDKQLFRRYLNGTYSCKEAEDLADRLAAEDRKLLSELADEVWEEAAMQTEASSLSREKYYREASELWHSLQPRSVRRMKRWVYAAVGMAASVLLVWGGISLYQKWEETQVTWASVQTAFGEQKEVALPDGSRIVLNACSRLQYPSRFVGERREVALSGEAFFKVASDKKKPFRVKTPEFQVQVLGTEFNVKSYQNDVVQSVEVESGKVQVELPEDRIRLSKQEQIHINRQSGEYSKRKQTLSKVAVWRKGTLHFNQTPMTDVARELERRYHCSISFRDGQVMDNLISGEHDNESLESILESLQYVCGIRYEKTGNQIVLYK